MQITRRWNQVGPEAKRLADRGLSPLAISEALGVDRSTVQRWMAAGKIADTRTSRTVEPDSPLAADLPSLAWAAAIRAAYPLDNTDDKLVALADLALQVAENPAESSSVRLAAMGRFQALTKQLASRIRPTVEDRAATPVQVETVTARADPRSLLNPTIQ